MRLRGALLLHRHMVFEELEKVSPIPLVSIVEATLDEAKKRGYKRVLLLGTKATMEDGSSRNRSFGMGLTW